MRQSSTNSCWHYKFLNIQKIRKWKEKLQRESFCQSCKEESAEELWMCLTCGHLRCRIHEKQHASEYPAHQVAYNIFSCQTWCYTCDMNLEQKLKEMDELDKEQLEDFIHQLQGVFYKKSMKKRIVMDADRDKEVVQVPNHNNNNNNNNNILTKNKPINEMKDINDQKKSISQSALNSEISHNTLNSSPNPHQHTSEDINKWEVDIRIGGISIEDLRTQGDLDKAQISNLEKELKLKIEDLERIERRHKEEKEKLEKRQKEEIKIAGNDVSEASENLENIKNRIYKRRILIEERIKEEFKKTEIYKEFKEDCICPITHEFMTDPVMAADGFSYEKQAITDWLEHHNTSPCTNMVLNHKFLTPNILLKNIIHTIGKI